LSQIEPVHLEYNTNRPGGDYGQRAILSAEACRTICSADGTCQAVTFVKPSPGTSMGPCYLTQTVPAPGCKRLVHLRQAEEWNTESYRKHS